MRRIVCIGPLCGVLLLAVLSPAWAMQGAATARPAQKAPAYGGKAAPPTGVAKAPKKTRGAIRLACFNVENLFDGQDDPALSGEHDDLAMATDETRLGNIAAAIRELDADVLALEEVESEACLKWFRDTYLKDLGYEHLASQDVGYDRGVEQSVLSRFPIEQVRTFTDTRLSEALSRLPADPAARRKQGWADPSRLANDGFQRSPLLASVRVPDGSLLQLIVVHFKAGGKKLAHQRELEALSVAGIVEEILRKDPSAQVAGLGDFNATPNQKAARLLREKETGGLVSAYEVRPDAGKGRGQDQGDDARRTHLTHSFVPDDQKGKPIERAIDFILLSPALFDKAAKGSYFVLGTPKCLESNDRRPKGYASDHNPVAVDLTLGAARP
ncbi:MAG: endonuclease/exonuclease/phosphatase family protein [Phycisphaerales bacterium]